MKELHEQLEVNGDSCGYFWVRRVLYFKDFFKIVSENLGEINFLFCLGNSEL